MVDVNAPIFIGGGGDGYKVLGQTLTNLVGPYVKRRGRGNVFTHWDDSKVRDAILAIHGARRPIVLIGHSWGGSDAIAAARWARNNGITVDLLVTIDPVGQPDYLIWSTGTYNGIARYWITVIASEPGIQAGDVVANAWGKTPMGIQGHAHRVVYDAKAGHADFPLMMERAHIESLIASAYKAGTR